MKLAESMLEGKFMLGFTVFLGTIITVVWGAKVLTILIKFAAHKIETYPPIEALINLFS